nr:diadenylate cyclase CdaA [uncultured Desulfobulbus sp.]
MFDALQSIRMLDIFDILIVSFIIYRIILLIRGTRAVQMLVGIALIIIIYFFSGKFELQTLHWLLKNFLGSILVVIVILFQTDIRRALTQMGRSPFHAPGKVGDREVEELIRAASFMARRRIGALLVIERDNGLRDYLDSGHRLDALLKAELLMAIFLSASPMHDGAVIISKGKIHSAGCLLPLSRNPAINKRYGTRHRAALGLSEESDAVIIVVSEETQEISLVQEGEITSYHDEKYLTNALNALFAHPMKQSLLTRLLGRRG